MVGPVASGTVEFFCQTPMEYIWAASALPQGSLTVLNRGLFDCNDSVTSCGVFVVS